MYCELLEGGEGSMVIINGDEKGKAMLQLHACDWDGSLKQELGVLFVMRGRTYVPSGRGGMSLGVGMGVASTVIVTDVTTGFGVLLSISIETWLT